MQIAPAPRPTPDSRASALLSRLNHVNRDPGLTVCRDARMGRVREKGLQYFRIGVLDAGDAVERQQRVLARGKFSGLKLPARTGRHRDDLPWSPVRNDEHGAMRAASARDDTAGQPPPVITQHD